MKNHVAGTVKVADVIPYARNPRTHSSAQVTKLAASIKEFGFTNPILIDEEGMVIAGHGRVMAAQKLGLEEVPSITLIDLTPAQKKALVIADNRLAEDAGWDNEMLTGLIHDLNEEGFDLGLTGFDDDEVYNFLKPISDDDMEIGSNSDESSSSGGKDYMSFGDSKIPVTEAEIARLTKALNDYVDENGAPYGFASFLLDGIS